MYSYSEEALSREESRREVEEIDESGEGDLGEEYFDGPKVQKESERNGACRRRSYYQYTLHGIIAHVGAINSGHYYSYIRVGGFADTEQSLGSWCEFNDNRVNEFNPNDIPNECFGGSQTQTIDGGSEVVPVTEHLRQHSAYMLVYRRTTTIDLKPVDSQSFITSSLHQSIVRENITLLRDRQVMSRMHFQFFWSLFSLIAEDNADKCVLSTDTKSALIVRVLRFTIEVKLL